MIPQAILGGRSSLRHFDSQVRERAERERRVIRGVSRTPHHSEALPSMDRLRAIGRITAVAGVLVLAPALAVAQSEKWSHHYNPANGSMGVLPAGNSVQDHGETLPDNSPLIDWSLLTGPGAPYWPVLDPAHHPGSPPAITWTTVGATPGPCSYTYEKTVIHTKSGLRIKIWRPTTHVASTCPIKPPEEPWDRDALVSLFGTKDVPYNAVADDPYYELETYLDGLAATDPKPQYLAGTPFAEALQLGHTVVIPLWSEGGHPVPWAIPQLFETVRFLESPAYSGSETTIRHRLFAVGGSLGGLLSLNACLWMPWAFRGGIVELFVPDVRQGFAFQETTWIYDAFLKCEYRGLMNNYSGLPILPTAIMDMETFDEPYCGWNGLSRLGHLRTDGTWEPYPMDHGAMSAIVQDHPSGSTVRQIDLLEQTLTPMTFVRSDDDNGHLSFFKAGANLTSSVTNLLRDYKVDVARHSGVAILVPGTANASSQYDPLAKWNYDKGAPCDRIYHEIVAQADAFCAPPLSSASYSPPAWTQAATAVYAPNSNLATNNQQVWRRSEQFAGFVNRPMTGLAIPNWFTPVNSAWLGGFIDMRALSGLGADGTLIAGDLRADENGFVEVVGSTSNGTIAMVQLDFASSGEEGYAIAWEVSSGSGYGNAEVAAWDPSAPAAGGTFVGLHRNGPLREYEYDLGAAKPSEVANAPTATTPYLIQKHLRSLRLSENSAMFVNDCGEVFSIPKATLGGFEFPGTPAVGYRTFVGMSAGSFLPTSPSNVLISSSYGNLYNMDLASPSHSPSQLGEHNKCFVHQLEKLPFTGMSEPRYLGLGWRITGTAPVDSAKGLLFAYDASLDHQLAAGRSTVPPTSLSAQNVGPFERMYVDPVSPSEIRIVGISGAGVAAMTVDSALDIQSYRVIASIPRASAITPFAGMSTPPAIDSEPVAFIVSLETGQLLAFSDPFGKSAPEVKLFGRSLGGSFGFIRESSTTAIVVAPNDEVYRIDPNGRNMAGNAACDPLHQDPVILASWRLHGEDLTPTSSAAVGCDTQNGADLKVHSIIGANTKHRQAAIGNGKRTKSDDSEETFDGVIGFPNGGDVLDKRWVAAMQAGLSTPPLTGGRLYIWDLDTIPVPAYSATSPESTLDKLKTHVPRYVSSPISGFQATSTGHDSVRWGDVDGDGLADVVVGTTGGRVVVFRNTSQGGPSSAPEFAAGTISNDPVWACGSCTGVSPGDDLCDWYAADIFWQIACPSFASCCSLTPLSTGLPTDYIEPTAISNDLGLWAIGLELADAIPESGDVKLEILVGTMCAEAGSYTTDEDIDLVEHAGVTIFEFDGSTLTVATSSVPSIPLQTDEVGAFGILVTNLADTPSTYPDNRDVLITTGNGRVVLYRKAASGTTFNRIGATAFQGSMLGAYSSLAIYPDTAGLMNSNWYRLLIASGSGIRALAVPLFGTP